MKKPSIMETIGGLLITGLNAALGIWLLSNIIKNAHSNNIPILEAMIRSISFSAYAIFFIICFLYIIIMTLVHSVIKQKEVVLICKKTKSPAYLVDSNKNIYEVYCKGKNKLEENKYYKVLKTGMVIDKIIEETEEKIEDNGIKENYWMTWYNPMNQYRGQLLLPILYVLFFFFIPMIIPSVVIFFLIGYDFYTKKRIHIQERELYKNNPHYTFKEYENLGNMIIAKDNHFFAKIINFCHKYSWLLLLLFFILLAVLIFI